MNLSSKLLYLTLKETQSCLKVLLQIAEKKVVKNPRNSSGRDDECDGAFDTNTLDDSMILEVEDRIKSLLSLHKQIAAQKESKLPKNYVDNTKNDEETDSESDVKITKPTKPPPKLTRQYSFNNQRRGDTNQQPLPNLPKRQLLSENRREDSDLDNLPAWMFLDLLEGNDPFKPVELDKDTKPATTAKTATPRNIPKEPHSPYGTTSHRGYELCKDDQYNADLPDCVHHVSYSHEDGMDSRRYPDLIKPCKQKFR